MAKFHEVREPGLTRVRGLSALALNVQGVFAMKKRTNGSSGQRSATAGRLLEELTADGAVTLRALAMVLEVPERYLAECRDGNGRLDPSVQLKLASLAPVMSPKLQLPARRLYAQARAALEFESNGAATRHASYPREQFR